MQTDALLNIPAFQARVSAGVKQYEHSAPALAAWLDNLYIQLGDDWRRIALWQVRLLDQLHAEGQWMQANLAQNTLYHWLDAMGLETAVVMIDH